MSMPTIIPARRDYVLEALRGFNESKAPERFAEYFVHGPRRKKLEEEERESENQFAQQLGLDLSGIVNPETRQKLLIEGLKQQSKRQLQGEKQDFLGQLFGSPSQSEGMPSERSERMPSQAFDPGLLPDSAIAQASAIDPNLGRLLQQQKDVALREKRAEREFEEKQKKSSPEYQRQQKLTEAQASADIKYNQELQSSQKQHEIKSQTLDRLEKLNKKGVTGKPYEKLLEKMGLVSLTSEGRREFAADVKNLITDIRSILGAQFSQFEFQTILNAYPSPDFSKEANASIIKNLQDFQNIRKKEFEIANQLKKGNGGKIPEDFQAIVNDKLQEYVQSKLPEIKENTRKIMNEEYGIKPGFVLMFDPGGEPLNVPMDQIEQYISLGAEMP